jgi:uncharacterized protein DUF4214
MTHYLPGLFVDDDALERYTFAVTGKQRRDPPPQVSTGLQSKLSAGLGDSMKIGICFLVIVLTGVAALAQSAPTLRIVTETPGLPSDLYYGETKVKPLRLRPGTNVPITIGDVDFFVQQQYIDFLGRMPDSTGFASWVQTLGACPNGGHGESDNPQCDRVHVSAGFYQSDEFLGRGYWAYRFYEVAFNRRPLYAEFVPDMQRVGGSQSPASEVTSKATYTTDFVQRGEFINLYNTKSNSQYLDLLEQNAEVALSNKAQLLTDLANGKSRAQVLREIIETQAVSTKFFNRGFVSMQYFGYLRRNPDPIGYQNWVDALEADPQNFRHMIFGFIYSTEYLTRF